MERSRTIRVGKGGCYTNWAAIAGFFDGDGSIDVDARAYTLHWVISFSDNWLAQIEQVRDFLLSHGIRVGKSRRVGKGGWTCEIKGISSMKKMATKMLHSGGTYKKRRELQLLVDYYHDKVTGTQVLEAFNSEVRQGIRIGKLRKTDMPYTHSEGLSRAWYASRYEQRTLNRVESTRLVQDYSNGGTTCRALAAKYDISASTVSRILKRAGLACRPRQRFLPGSPVQNWNM